MHRTEEISKFVLQKEQMYIKQEFIAGMIEILTV